MSVVDRIEGWALAICRMDDLPLAEAAVELGVTGPFEVDLYGSDHLLAVSPPPGTERLELTGRGGVLSTVRVSPSEGEVCVADLEERFGASWPVAHMPDSPYSTVGFGPVVEPGTGHACTLFADVRSSPTPTSSVITVLLRRDPARPPALEVRPARPTRTLTLTQMDPVVVRPRPSSLALRVLLALLLAPLALGNLFLGLTQGAVVPLGIGLLTVATFGGVAWLVRRGHRMSVRSLTAGGLVRHDGRELAWADLDRVVDRVRVRPSGKRFLWRTEIRFRNGDAAWVLPAKIQNYEEVGGWVRRLPCEHAEESA